jgi:hypothetical protein
MDFQLTLHETPPSLNAFGSVGGGTHHRYRRLKKQWQEQLGTALMVAKVPRGLAKVSAAAMLTFPEQRPRDEGNFRFLLEKALGDALVEGGWLEDDTADHFEFGRVFFSEQRGDPLTAITLHAERQPAGEVSAPKSPTAPNSQRESEDKLLPPTAHGTQQRRWRRRVKG